jgi:hypothetical protein
MGGPLTESCDDEEAARNTRELTSSEQPHNTNSPPAHSNREPEYSSWFDSFITGVAYRLRTIMSGLSKKSADPLGGSQLLKIAEKLRTGALTPSRAQKQLNKQATSVETYGSVQVLLR